MWTLYLPVAIPSANVLKRSLWNGNRHAYAKVKTAFALAAFAIAHQQKVSRAGGKRRIAITRLYWGQGKEMDHDNLVAGCKPLLDSLVKLELLVDDAPAHCEVTYRQERVGEKSSNPTIVTIEEMDEMPKKAKQPSRLPNPKSGGVVPVSVPPKRAKRQPELPTLERDTIEALEDVIADLMRVEAARKENAEREKTLRESGIAELMRLGLDSYTAHDGDWRYTLRRQDSHKAVLEKVRVRTKPEELL